MTKKRRSTKKLAKTRATKSVKKPAVKRHDVQTPVAEDGLLTGWTAIAKYLGQSASVAERWAKDGMPVSKKGRFMTAVPEELGKWLGRESGAKSPVHITQGSDEDLLADLRRGLKEVRSAKRK